MKPLVWRVWVQATMPSKCLRTIRATSFIGSTLEPVSKGTQTPAQARETARSGGRLHGFLPGRGDHRDGRSTLSKRALRAQDIGAPLPEHGGDDVDLLAVEDIAKMLTIEPGARRALCGGLGDQAVEIGATFVREAIAVLEQRPAQPFEAQCDRRCDFGHRKTALYLESGRRCRPTGPLRERSQVTRVRSGSPDCCSNLLPLNWVWQQGCAQIKPLVWLGMALRVRFERVDHARSRAILRVMSMTEAAKRKAVADLMVASTSLARRRFRFSQAKVRSTTQRFGSRTKPLAVSERLMISMVQSPSLAKASRSLSPAYPPSAKT